MTLIFQQNVKHKPLKTEEDKMQDSRKRDSKVSLFEKEIKLEKRKNDDPLFF